MLVEDLRALPEPICVEYQGSMMLADGYHRFAALSELAREFPGDRRFQFVSIRIVNTPSGQQPGAFAYEVALERSANGPLPLTRAEKRAAIERLVIERPEWSNRDIARRVGVDHKTVGAVRKRGNSPSHGPGIEETPTARSPSSAARLSRIATRLVSYGDELGTEDSEVDNDDLVAVLASTFRRLHPTTASDWAAWWETLWAGVRAELEADA